MSYVRRTPGYLSGDPSRINELLAQLQNSTAFQNAVTSGQASTTNQDPVQDTASNQPAAPAQPTPSVQPPSSGSTVFELLSRLNPSSATANPPHPPLSRAASTDDYTSKPPPLAESSTSGTSTLDLRYMTVQQALPHISKLAQRVEFREKVKKLQEAQNQLEQSLYSSQRELMNKHEQRVTYAKNKANITGVSLTQKDNEELASQLAEELKKFNASRVLVAWDSQRTKQQSQLESLGVPCMFVTSEPTALQRQQKVLRILMESINESEDMS